jgi:hypothetical protein
MCQSSMRKATHLDIAHHDSPVHEQLSVSK